MPSVLLYASPCTILFPYFNSFMQDFIVPSEVVLCICQTNPCEFLSRKQDEGQHPLSDADPICITRLAHNKYYQTKPCNIYIN